MKRNNLWLVRMFILLSIFLLVLGCTTNRSQVETTKATTIFSATSTTAPALDITPIPEGVKASVTPAEIVTPSLSLKTTEPKVAAFHFQPPLPSTGGMVDFDPNIIMTMMFDRDGFLWTSGRDGLMRWEIATGTYTGWNDGQGLGGIYDMAQAEDGSLWFATDHGVLHYDGYQWNTYPTDNGLANNAVYAIAMTPDGAMWFTIEQGIMRLFNGTWTVFKETRTGQSLAGLWLLTVAPDGTLWSAGMSTMLVFFQGDHWEEAVQVPEDSGYINDLAVTKEGFVWLGGSKVLYQFNGTGWVGFNPWRAESIGSVNAIAAGPDGNLYVGLWVDCVLHECQILDRDQRKMPGIYRYDGYQWRTLNNEAGIANSEVCSMAVGQDSLLWIGTCQDGVLQFDGHTWQRFQVK